MLEYFLLFTTVMFIQGSFGMLYPQYHLIMSLLSLEVMLLAVNLNYVIYSIELDDLIGQIYAIMILAIAAAETAIGLAIVVCFYRYRGGISILLIDIIKA